jgi:hypothetical protein
MKTTLFAGAVLGFAAAALLTGCVEHRVVYVQAPPPGPAPPTVVVTERPPAPVHEGVMVSPGPAYAWMPGYWTWNGRWIWVSGCWVACPHPHAVLVPGHWAHHGHGYVWVNGYWR